ncbi:interleukin 15, like isoform X2 [Cheilinus undulatus]|uniref:interleukin 15, like isoform X2 n=1 Tax=Cheilinus undulatus TaxID=241271 RepID=UPI001BD2ABE3|nr:interleukin 15, like isoform X2 [Cheilinus undulatus]
MLTGRRGLASVCLCFFCLLTLPQQPAALNCYRDILHRVKTLSKVAPLNSLDCMLYTPAIDDYENCSKSALKCFAAEVTVIIQEWKTIEKVNRKWDLDEKLAEVADLLNQTNPECLQCEQLKEENAKDFFRVLETFIQLMNSAPGDCKSYS